LTTLISVAIEQDNALLPQLNDLQCFNDTNCLQC